MRKANRKMDELIYRRLAEARMTAHDRSRAAHAMRDAEVIVEAIVWVKDKIASLGAMLLRPGFKH